MIGAGVRERSLLAAALAAILVAGCGSADHPRAVSQYGRLNLSFEPNVGQAPRGASFVARGRGAPLLIGRDGLAVGRVGVRLAGARRDARPAGERVLPGKVNAFLGSDPRRWRTGVPTYGSVRYRDLYPGVDVVVHGSDGQAEYDFVVAPGADSSRIALAATGTRAFRVDGRGDLIVGSGRERVVQRRPVAYQLVGGKRVAVPARFMVQGRLAGFALGRYDHARPLLIDPVLVYSTYIGGGGSDDAAAAALDGSGRLYLVGTTTSSGATPFPTANPIQPSHGGGTYDAFVLKLNPQGTGLVYSTYLGGSNIDSGSGIAVDGQGSAYASGYTLSSGSPGGFPTANALQPSSGSPGMQDGWVAKLSPAGNSLVYSTYLGSTGRDFATRIAVDGQGNAFVAGSTDSAGFPSVNAFQPTKSAGTDAYAAKLNAQGSALVYSTFLGGSGTNEQAGGIAIDGQGNAYVTGQTDSPSGGPGAFPTVNPIQPNYGGGSSDAFVTKLNPQGNGLVYSTYLGGGGGDYGSTDAVGADGSLYLTGFTDSTGATPFPTVNPIQASNGGMNDAFVTKLNPQGTALAYSTYLGGGSLDEGFAIKVDCTGAAWVGGRAVSTAPSGFPTANPLQANNSGGGGDAFVSLLNPAGSALSFSTYLGGSGFDYATGLAIDDQGDAYVAGATSSSGANGFPTVNPFQSANNGSSDAFAAKIKGDAPSCPTSGGGGGGGTGAATTVNQLPVTPPAPTPPDGTTTFRGLRVDRKLNLIFTYDVRAAGRMLVVVTGPPSRLAVATRKKKRKKPLAVGRGSATATGPGPLSVTVKPSRRAKALIRKRGRLAVTAAATFTPNGGNATTTTTKTTAVAPKKKPARRR
jgi:Beta-propeller repeat